MTENLDELEGLRAEIARLRASEAELEARAARAEQNLDASHALLAAAFDNLPFDFWARDQNGYCTLMNATCRANWGDLLHKRPQDAQVPPHVLETWVANNHRALAGEIVRGEYEYERDGETRYVSNILAPIRVDGGIVGTTGVNIDVTELKRALLALRDSQEKLCAAVDTAGVGFWTWDSVRDEVVWEPTLSEIFGLPAGTAPAGREAYLALIHPDDREAVGAKIAAGIKAGRWDDEYRIVRPDGAVRWLMGKGIAIGAERTRVVGANIDVTERKERDEQLRQAQKLEAVGQLTAGIAHNFNNMLMGVLPNIEFAMGRAPAELVPVLESALESAGRAAELVRKLMVYAGRSRPGARTVEEISPLVARAVELCRTTFDKRIAFELASEAGARAQVDATQIEQALLNLLINARDAMECPTIEAPRLTVSVSVVRAGASELAEESARDHVRVRVRDNGVGMDAATAKRIYEPFFTTKEVGKGTGLGLATTRAIVREHGGFITCESAKGRGTTFSFYLPLEQALPERDRATPEPPSARGTETVLVVDDEPAIRKIVSRMLGSEGYTTLEAASGTEALELLADPAFASKVALVLLDVSMPGLPRRELRSRLRGRTRARVVYFTGYPLDASDADPDDVVLEKPVNEEQLLRTIRQALDRR